MEEVAAWLGTIRLQKHSEVFADRGIDGAALVELDKSALAELGLGPVDQAVFRSGVDKLKAGGLTVCLRFAVN